MTEEKKRFIIIDCNSVFHRAFHALPPLKNKKGELVNAVYGFLLFFFRAIKDFQPEFIAACFDLPFPTFRHEKFKEYKAKRPAAPPELYEQIPKLKEFLAALSVPVFEKEGFEADDLIGTISKLVSLKQVFPKVETIILSGDKDAFQLINENTRVYNLKRGIKETAIYDEEAIKSRYGIRSSQLTDFKALRGDPSDNIPGVTGIGEKIGIQLIKEFGSLNNLYAEIKKESDKARKIKESTKEKLIKYKEQAFLSRELVEIDRNVNIDFNLEKCRRKNNGYDKEKIGALLTDFGFYSLLKRLPDF